MLVYNAQSSHHAAVEREVLAPARQLKGWMVGKYAIKPTSFGDNVANLAKLVNDGDLVIVAGGDGTATMTINGVLRAQKKVTLAVLGYGNFNDIAGMLGAWPRDDELGQVQFQKIVQAYEAQRTDNLYPLEVVINDRHWRYAAGYVTIGLLAQATTLLEQPKVRQQLDTGKRNAFYSLRQAVKWYLKHHRHNYLPAGALNGAPWPEQATDILAVNSPRLAQLMRGGDWWQDPEQFGSSVQCLGKFWKMVRFGLKSIRTGVPLAETTGDLIEFMQPSSVEIQVEGEYESLEQVEKILIQKTSQPLKVITKQNLEN